MISPKTKAFLEAACRTDAYPLYLFGAPGTGKTSAAACLYCHSIYTGPNKGDWSEPLFKSCSAFIREMLADQKAYDRHLARVLEASFFVLDDLGRRALTAPQRDCLQDILDARGTKPAVYTSNHNPEELKGALADPRLDSRILCGGPVAWIKFDGEDQRFAAHMLRMNPVAYVPKPPESSRERHHRTKITGWDYPTYRAVIHAMSAPQRPTPDGVRINEEYWRHNYPMFGLHGKPLDNLTEYLNAQIPAAPTTDEHFTIIATACNLPMQVVKDAYLTKLLESV